MTLTMLLVAGGASVMLLLREAAPGGRTRSRVYTWPAMASECLAALSADWTVGWVGGWVIVCELVDTITAICCPWHCKEGVYLGRVKSDKPDRGTLGELAAGDSAKETLTVEHQAQRVGLARNVANLDGFALRDIHACLPETGVGVGRA